MQEAEKAPLIELALRLYEERLIRSRLASLQVKADLAVYEPSDIPTIYYGNHSSRWDHVVGTLISQHLWHQETYLMVNSGVLWSYPILQKTGCFSIDPTDPLDVAKGIKYSKQLLEEKPNRVLWIFPQGIILPNDLRPLKFQNGLAQLVRNMDKVRLVPVSFRLEFLISFKPTLYVVFGKPRIFSRDMKVTTRTLTNELETTVIEQLDQLKADILSGTTGEFTGVYYGKGLFATRVFSKVRQIMWVLKHRNDTPLAKQLEFAAQNKTAAPK